MVHGKYTIVYDTLLNSGYNFTWENNFPIFNENYRNTLVTKIKDYFKFYEIGAETPYLFDNLLKTKLNTIMNYYNQLYEIEVIKDSIGFENLLNKRYMGNTLGKNDNTNTTHFTGDIDGQTQTVTNNRHDNFYTTTMADNSHNVTTSTNNGNATTETANLTADTPQSEPNITSAGDTKSVTTGDITVTKFDDFNNAVFQESGYITQANKTLNVNEDKTTNRTEYTADGSTITDNTGYGTDTNNQNTSYTTDTDNNTVFSGNIIDNRNSYGNNDYIKSITDLREQILNIDLQIIEELKECFLQVF